MGINYKSMDYRFNQFEFNIEPMANQSVRQGRSRAGKTVFYKPTKVTNYQKDIQAEYLEQLKPLYETYTGPAKVTITYVFKYLKKHSKKLIRENEGQIWYKDTKPDLDSNLNKPLIDALCGPCLIASAGPIWKPMLENDSRIAVIQACKIWGPEAKIVLTVEGLDG